MRWRNSGIFYFCKELSNAILQEQPDMKYDLEFYVRKRNKGVIGNVPYLIKKKYHKIFFWNPQIKLWHSTFQLRPNLPYNTLIVQTIHDLNYLYEDITAKEKDKIRKDVSKCIRHASHIVAISEYVKKDILQYFDIGNKPISVIYNGCNVYNGEVKTPAYVPQRPFLFFVGGILWKKNIQVLPCLLKGNNYELVIAGSQDKEEHTACIQAIMKEGTEWGVQDRIHILGPIPDTEKVWYYQNCKAFLFPSLAEGFGLPVLEAMQWGKPVFLSNHTSLPEIGGKYAYYFNHDFNRQMMIEEFNKGLNDFYNRDNAPEQVKNHALQFSWKNAAKQYWNIYKELLNK